MHFVTVLGAVLASFGGFYLIGWLADELFAVSDASRRSYERRARHTTSVAVTPARGK